MTLINFRDFGGLATASAQRVRTDRLYRCGHLAQCDDDDVAQLLALDFASIADLRYPGERTTEPSPWPESYADRISTQDGERRIEAPHLVMLRTGALTTPAVVNFYHEFYRDLPFDDLYRPLFAQTIRNIAGRGGRMLVHCTAGKDRTGILVALLLDTLGVPRDAIIAEYMQSATAPGLLAMKPEIIDGALRRYGHVVSGEAVDALLHVDASYLEIMFHAIAQREGSVRAYLGRSGIDDEIIASLREQLLE